MNKEFQGKFEHTNVKDEFLIRFSALDSMFGIIRVIVFLFVSGVALKFSRSLYADGDVGLALLCGVVAAVSLVSGFGHLAVCVFSRFSQHDIDAAGDSASASVKTLAIMGAMYLGLLVVVGGLAWQLVKWVWNLL